jgi:hypothetical protein
MANKPKKTKKRKGKIRVRTGARVVKKDSVRRNKLIRESPFIMNDNSINIRVKIVPKSSGSINEEFNRRRSE